MPRAENSTINSPFTLSPTSISRCDRSVRHLLSSTLPSDLMDSTSLWRSPLLISPSLLSSPVLCIHSYPSSPLPATSSTLLSSAASALAPPAGGRGRRWARTAAAQDQYSHGDAGRTRRPPTPGAEHPAPPLPASRRCYSRHGTVWVWSDASNCRRQRRPRHIGLYGANFLFRELSSSPCSILNL